MKRLLLFLSVIMLLTVCVRAENVSWTAEASAKAADITKSQQNLAAAGWTLSHNSTAAISADATKGLQIGTGSNPAKLITITSGIDAEFYGKKITSIKINASTASSATATLSVKLDNQIIDTKSLSTAATDYTFNAGIESNVIVIEISQPSTSKALYLKSITVNYEDNNEESKLKDPNLKFSKTEDTATIGQPFTPPVLTKDTDAVPTYSSSETSVATVNNDGSVELNGEGTTVITASVPETSEYNSGSISYSLTVIDDYKVEHTSPVTFDFVKNAYGMTRNDDKNYNKNPTTLTINPISVTFDGGNNRLWNDGMRFYSNSNFTLAIDKGVITKIEITYQSASASNSFALDSSSTGNYTTSGQTRTWTGNAKSVKFNYTANSSQQAVNAITVYFDRDQDLYVEAPTFKPDPREGKVELGTKVKLACATEGAEIHYMFGDVVDDVYSDATEIILSKENYEIMAWAVVGKTSSEEVVAEYEFLQVATPVIEPKTEFVTEGTKVTISCATEGATIYYMDALEHGDYQVYEPGKTEIIINEETIIETYATKPNWLDSETVTADFNIAGAHDQIPSEFTFDFTNESENVSAIASKSVEPTSEQKKGDSNDLTDVTFTAPNGVTLAIAASSSASTNPRWWNTGEARFYADNTLTISAPAGHEITKIEFGAGSDFKMTDDNLDANTKVWTSPKDKEFESVSFTPTAKTFLKTIAVDFQRTAHVPELVADFSAWPGYNTADHAIYQVKHGVIKVKIVDPSTLVDGSQSGDLPEEDGLTGNAVRRKADDSLPANWEYLNDQTLLYTVPSTNDNNVYEVYSVFGDDDENAEGVKVSESVTHYGNSATGVDEVAVEAAANGEVEYFNLQGVKVQNPEKGGIYIMVVSGKAAKVVL